MFAKLRLIQFLTSSRGRLRCLLLAVSLCSNQVALNGEIHDTENYQLQPGDVIAMNVYQEPDLNLETRLAADGTVRFPLIGTVNASGKTASQLQNDIYELYNKDYLVNPQISLHILEYSQQRVRVRGKVNKPGFVVIPPEESFSLLDVIAAAGDIASGGNEKKVELHRTSGTGEIEILTFDLSKKSSRKNSSDMLVRNNDLVVVPEKLF